MGLDDVRFGGLCTTIINIDPLHGLGEIYAKIIREEQRLALARKREQQQDTMGFVVCCDLFEILRHVNRCEQHTEGGKSDNQWRSNRNLTLASP